MSESKYVEYKRRWARWRDRLRERPMLDAAYRVAVGVVGTVVFLIGVVTIPYPGPGWAIVFLGLGILATEFRSAQKVLHYAKERYDKVMAWFVRQHIAVKALSALFTAAVVVLSLWALGALFWFGDLVGFEPDWLKSPFGIGS